MHMGSGKKKELGMTTSCSEAAANKKLMHKSRKDFTAVFLTKKIVMCNPLRGAHRP